jgi:flagellar motor switch protein FliN/FliY
MAEEEASAVPEEAAAAAGDEQFTADDWAAAMAEQAGAEASPPPAAASVAPAVAPAAFDSITADIGLPPEAAKNLELVMDIPVQITVELGRTRMPIRNLLQLAQGSVVELNELAGEPLDVFVNGCLVAQGEVVVVNDNFGIRLIDIITPSERLKKLR